MTTKERAMLKTALYLGSFVAFCAFYVYFPLYGLIVAGLAGAALLTYAVYMMILSQEELKDMRRGPME
jgi:hypothetical protein